ncbi:MAG: PHB depolymerase family esterase [Deltaproteobacteria bacterium]|nr:PHB depolymerase family esterase [Deltaproteobacteria bacterium]
MRLPAWVGLIVFVASTSARPAAAQGWSTRSTAGMSVELYLPIAAPYRSSGRGLLIALHGCTQQNTVLKQRGNFEPAAERFGMVVALPAVPNGGVIAGCWDYYGSNHTRSNRHNRPLIELAEALVADASLGIDAAEVFLAGLSSGAGQAMVTGCVAPDVFAGVGINAGPTVGTESSQIGQVATTLAAASALCRRLAGAEAASFETQQTSVIAGTRDFIVAQDYALLDAQVMAEVYRGNGPALDEVPIDVSALDGHQPSGQGRWWRQGSTPRVSWVLADGMGHAFPAGSGPGAEISFVASQGVAWPVFLGEFFVGRSLRASGVAADGGAGDVAPRIDFGDGSDGSIAGDSGGGDASRGGDAGSSNGDPPATEGCSCRGSSGAHAGALLPHRLLLLLLLGAGVGARRRRRSAASGSGSGSARGGDEPDQGTQR